MERTSVSKGKIVAAGLLALVVLAGVVLGGWQAGWWFRRQNTLRNDQMYDTSYGRQTALKDQVTKNIALTFTITVQIGQSNDPATTDPLKAQRKAVVTQVCADAARINPSNPLTGDQAVFVRDHCLAGVVNPQSIYAN